LLVHLAGPHVHVDCYFGQLSDAVPSRVADHANIRVFAQPLAWHPSRWYSRSPLSRFITGQTARIRAQRLLLARLEAEHERRPYDVLYQFSQIELFGLRALARRVPLVLHPEVHARGELRWHRRERSLIRKYEPRGHHAIVRSMLTARSAMQQRDIRLARGVVAPSNAFARDLCSDYGIEPARLAVIPNPIDLRRYRPRDRNGATPLTALFVSRIAVRKGVEMIVELSHRLADLAGEFRLFVVGGQGAWSDYRPVLRGLNPETAEYLGRVDAGGLPGLYASSDLLIQPSHYEPFALTVGEALASGRPVVVSDRVGAAEGVDSACCIRVPDGDAAALERGVRAMAARLRVDAPSITDAARSEAERLFSADVIGTQIAEFLRRTAAA
jgi:glycosyltransferase involved in cell wall biosynthesis